MASPGKGVDGADDLTDADVASAAATTAAWEMAETEPTTATGAAVMLRYLTRDPIYGVWEAFEYGKAVWLRDGVPDT